jgi:hypothetical protein
LSRDAFAGTGRSDDEALAAAVLIEAGLPEPDALRSLDHGMSGDLVMRLISGDRVVYAKHCDPARRISCAELGREAAALRWLDGRFGAPKLVWAGDALGRPAILTAGIEGVALHELPAERAEVGAIAALAALAALHRASVADCPFDERLTVKFSEVRRRLEAGEIEPAMFEAEHQGQPLDALGARSSRLVRLAKTWWSPTATPAGRTSSYDRTAAPGSSISAASASRTDARTWRSSSARQSTTSQICRSKRSLPRTIPSGA